MTRSLLSIFFLVSTAASYGALSVTPSLTTGVQTFSSTPANTEWSTVSMAGGAGTLATVTAVDNAAQALTAAGIATTLGAQAGNASNAIAQRNSTANFIYTAATGNNATALMATLQNDSGSALSTITVAYDHTRIGGGVEESMGHRVFYSLTGAANSWTAIPALSGIGTNQALTANATLSASWASGAKLYLLWVDDNGSGSDGPFTLDNFVVTASANTPPTATLTAPANGAFTGAPGTFALTATATDNGSVTQVEFLRNGSVIHTDTTSPYSFSDSGLAVGSHSYTARATDNLGVTTTSAAAVVNVFTDPTKTALQFDGVNDYVTMGPAPTLGTATFTIECWFKRTGAGTGNASTGSNGIAAAIPLVTKGRSEGDNSAIDCNYFLGIDTATGRICADFEATLSTPLNGTGGANNNYPVYGTTVIANNVWTHAAATWDGAGWKLFVNGVEETTTSPNTLPSPAPIPRSDSTQHFSIGSALNSFGVAAGFFQGVIDEARVWNFARTPAVVASGKDVEIASGTGLIGRYGLNEATGTTASAPSGTLTNGPLWVDGYSFAPVVPPTVAITAPANNASFMVPVTVAITADASDSDGTITKVEFFNGATKIGEDLIAPYQFDWSRTTADTGTFSLTAKATDNVGAVTISTAVSITITPNSNQPTVITLNGPADNAIGIGSSVNLSLGLADPEGDATTVTFYGRKTTSAVPGPDFTIGTIPDTQFYSQGGASGNGRGPTFGAQMQWYLDNRNSAVLPNLAFITHQGDICENGDAIPEQWIVADEAMKRIESPSTSFLPYGIPYGVTPGNHDFGTGGGTGSTTLYNQYFGIPRFAGRNYYGDGFGGNNLSSYQLFSASGLDFISISLEYNVGAKSTYQAQLDWADALLKAHPNRRALVTTHWMVNTGNPASFSAQGQNIYDDLKDNPNLFLLLGGHVAGEGRRSDTFQGRTVHAVLQDYQARANGGDGWLRYFIFSPANNTITAKTYRVSNPLNPAAGTFETDADSEFVLSYPQQSSVSPWIPLGTVNVPASGTAADLNWTGLEKGSDYEWYATSFDGVSTTTSASRRFSTTAASAPVVTLTAPATGASYALPATIEITADATDADGTVARVDFYQGSTRLFTDTAAPFAYSWTGASSGTYSLTATAVDNENRATLSNAVTVTVTNPGNVAPSVALTSPANGSSAAANSSIPLAATASDTDGTVTKVEFFLGVTKIGEDLSSPYTLSYTLGPVGSYTFTAKATDNDGGFTISSALTINATPAVPFVSGYAQNFDAMGTGTTPPSGWQVFGAMGGDNATWENGTGIPASTVGVGTMNNSLVVYSAFSATPSTPSPDRSNTQGYNLAETASTTNRALGSSPTSGAGIALQLELTNTGTQAVSAVSMAYDIRRFTTAAANHLPGLRLFYSLDEGFSWTNVAALDPTIAGPGGIIVPATLGVTAVPATEITLGSPWYVGGTLRFRWVDDNAVATSPDQISGLDNLAVVATQFVPVVGIAPVVALINPAANSSFLTADTIQIEADATDSDGTITKVEFFRGAVKLGEDTTQPYAYSWSFPPAGSFSLTARATDSAGNIVSSAPRIVTVTLAPGSSGPMLRSPYLNQANHNSIVVRWRSTQANIGRVRYGLTPGNLSLSTDEASAQTNHVVRLTGLTPATRYYYSVGSAVDILTPETVDTTSVRTAAFTIPAPTAADYTFRTSPGPGTAPVEGTRIWVVGDCGRGSATQAAGRDAYYNWMGSRTPDLNLQMGDNAYNAGTDAEYQTGYFQMYPTIFRKMTQWSTLGNHDANNGDTNPLSNPPYFDMFTFPTAGECGGTASGTEHYYSFDYGNVHFISLDSQTTLASRAAGAAQTLWLQNDLASTTQPWKIVFFHHPGYSKGSHDSDSEGQMVLMREIYHPIMEAGGVDLVLTGHSHNYERSVLLDGHYGVSSTITPAMKIDSGNGSTTGFTTAFTTAGDNGKIRIKGTTAAVATVNGAVIPPDGAYKKPLLGPLDHTGTIYNTAGMSGQADGGPIDHSAMYISYDTVGTVNLDITGNTLVATYVQADGNTPDNYTIIKSGEADRDRDGVSDSYEIANGLSRFNGSDAQASAGDGDGISNFLEFAFGLNPNATDGGPIVADVPNGMLSQRGQPTVWYQSTTTGTDFRALFIRRKNAVDAGLIYIPQFSGDLLTWTNSTATPVVIADAGEVELVSVRYPFFAGGKKARYFRIGVSVNP